MFTVLHYLKFIKLGANVVPTDTPFIWTAPQRTDAFTAPNRNHTWTAPPRTMTQTREP